MVVLVEFVVTDWLVAVPQLLLEDSLYWTT
jgi:hypothetical protein